MKNLMPEIAALLGVEIGEEFDIEESKGNPFGLTKSGLFNSTSAYDQPVTLSRLLTGEWTIIKKPWKPKNGDVFHFVNVKGEVVTMFFYIDVTSCHAMLHAGNRFRTEQEAEANREAIMEKFGWK